MTPLSKELQEAELFFGKIKVVIRWLRPEISWELILDFAKTIPKIELWTKMQTDRVYIWGSWQYYLHNIWNKLYRYNGTTSILIA